MGPIPVYLGMDTCCAGKTEALAPLRTRKARVLKALLGANAAMFFIELGLGLAAGSTALLGDSLDMLGDALVYAATLHVLDRSESAKARAVLLKGAILAGFGLAVLAEAVSKLRQDASPEPVVMGGAAIAALAVNVSCLLLLLKHRHEDINMRAAWICSRNDIVANVSVLVAGAAVAWLGSAWPDIVVGSGLAGLFMMSSANMSLGGLRALRAARAGIHPPS